MPELDKWQKREAEQRAKDNGVSYEDAVAELFPGDVAEAPAEAEVAEGDGGSTPAPKVSTAKASSK